MTNIKEVSCISSLKNVGEIKSWPTTLRGVQYTLPDIKSFSFYILINFTMKYKISKPISQKVNLNSILWRKLWKRNTGQEKPFKEKSTKNLKD